MSENKITCPVCGGTAFKPDPYRPRVFETQPDFVYCTKCLSSYNRHWLEEWKPVIKPAPITP